MRPLLSFLLFAVSALPVAAQSRRTPAFGTAVVITIEQLTAQEPLAAAGIAAQEKADAGLYVQRALRGGPALEEAGVFLDSLGPQGRKAKQTLVRLAAQKQETDIPRTESLTAAETEPVITAEMTIAALDAMSAIALQGDAWPRAFDGSVARTGDITEPVPVDPGSIDAKPIFSPADITLDRTGGWSIGTIPAPTAGFTQEPLSPDRGPLAGMTEVLHESIFSGPFMAPLKAMELAEALTFAVAAGEAGHSDDVATVPSIVQRPNLIVAPSPESHEPPAEAAEEKSGVLRIVAVPVEKLKEIAGKGKDATRKAARKELYKERKADLNQAFGIRPGTALGGAGAFRVKILSPDEVKADPIKQKVRDEGLARDEKLVFIRTHTVAQLFGTHTIPIDIPIGPAMPSLGLRLNGVIEIIRTRVVPRDRSEAFKNIKRRVFLWPLNIEMLKNDLRVGEDVTITARLDRAAALGIGFGTEFGDFLYAKVGARARASVGRAKDKWVSLTIKKTSEDTVRVILQRGDGKVLSAMVQLYAGLDIYDDEWIPSVAPTNLEDSFIGGVITEKGGKLIVKKLEKLLSAEISLAFTRGKHGISTEGWGSVSLTDPKTSQALTDLFHFAPQTLRDLPVDMTHSDLLGTGRIRSRIRDVTNETRFKAHLSLLGIEKTKDTKYYEVQWQIGDGETEHYLVGIAGKRFKGKVTKTRRSVETVMWHDLKRNRTTTTVRLGPQKRLMTTTREVINDVIATLRALKVDVQYEIDHPGVYLRFFGLGNYGRTEETGWFSLSPEGAQSVGKATGDELLTAYLNADWLYERESYPPGYIWADASEAPPWADTSDPEALKPVLDFLAENAATVRSNSPGNGNSYKERRLKRAYRRLAPGRSLRSDSYRFLRAQRYAGHISAMQEGASPEKMIELFLNFRKDSSIDLKRAVVATANLAGGTDNFDGTIQMTGKRVTLIPLDKPADAMPAHPITQFNGIVNTWKR